MKYTFWTFILAIIVMLIIWLAIKYMPDNSKEVNYHTCVEVYGLDENCGQINK